LKVRFVEVVNKTPPLPFSVTVLEPRLIVLVLVLLDASCEAMTLLLLVVNVPAVTFKAPLHVNVPPRLSVALVELIVTKPTEAL
jgi:hypothetical protein